MKHQGSVALQIMVAAFLALHASLLVGQGPRLGAFLNLEHNTYKSASLYVPSTISSPAADIGWRLRWCLDVGSVLRMNLGAGGIGRQVKRTYQDLNDPSIVRSTEQFESRSVQIAAGLSLRVLEKERFELLIGADALFSSQGNLDILVKSVNAPDKSYSLQGKVTPGIAMRPNLQVGYRIGSTWLVLIANHQNVGKKANEQSRPLSGNGAPLEPYRTSVFAVFIGLEFKLPQKE